MTGSYFGGKSGSGTYQTIINQIPEHKHYIEGFAGKAGVFRKMNTAATCLLIELDPLLFPAYHEAGFVETVAIRSYLEKRAANRQMCMNSTALFILNTFRMDLDKPDVFIYLDPPYPLESRKSGPKYRYEMSDEAHHKLMYIVKLYEHAKIAISTYPNEIYSNHLASWRMIEFESQTRRGKATENLYMNYAEPAVLQDFQYVGDNYRERERIARMQRRWRRKFDQLPEKERLAMLQHLQS